MMGSYIPIGMQVMARVTIEAIKGSGATIAVVSGTIAGKQVTQVNLHLTTENAVDLGTVKALDLSQCPKLVYLDCASKDLVSIDLSQCADLEQLYCFGNKLTSIDVSHCVALYDFWCNENLLTTLDVSKCPELTTLNCYDNQLSALDISQCQKLSF